MNKLRNALLNTTTAVALGGLTSIGANAQVQYNSLILANGGVVLGAHIPTVVNIIGTASTAGVFVGGISQDAFGLGNPTVDSWNTFLEPCGGLSWYGPGILATYMVPAGTHAGVYHDNLYFLSHEATGEGMTVTPFTITVINIAGHAPEPGNIAMLVGFGLTGAAFLRRRRSR